MNLIYVTIESLLLLSTTILFIVELNIVIYYWRNYGRKIKTKRKDYSKRIDVSC